MFLLVGVLAYQREGVVDKCCSPHSSLLSYISVSPQPAMTAPDKAKLSARVPVCVCVCALHVNVYENRWDGCVFCL